MEFCVGHTYKPGMGWVQVRLTADYLLHGDRRGRLDEQTEEQHTKPPPPRATLADHIDAARLTKSPRILDVGLGKR
jgi:hypothetical protein